MTLCIELDSPDRLKVRYWFGKVSRVMLVVLSSVPLAGAFSMLRWLWESPFGLASVFVMVLALGAALVGGGLLFAAGGSYDELLDVDRRAGTVTRIDVSKLGHRCRESRPLAQISRLETHVEEWSDSSPSYHLAIHFHDGGTMRFGSSNIQAPVDELRDRLARFLGG
jgi:hypothetical protein